MKRGRRDNATEVRRRYVEAKNTKLPEVQYYDSAMVG